MTAIHPTQVDHIGIAVASLEAAVPFYRDVLGLEYLGAETIADQGVRTAIFLCGEVRIELLEPSRADSPIAKFIASRGEGLHHVAYLVGDVAESVQTLADAGLRMVDASPRPGAHHRMIAFLHPHASAHVLTEVCQAVEPEVWEAQQWSRDRGEAT